MDDQQQSRWRQVGRQVLLTVGVVVAVSAVVFVVNHFFVHRPLWAWLKLLIVPAVLARGGLWFNAQQREREQNTAQHRATDEALQAYLDQMGQLLLDKDRPLRQSKAGDEVRTLARARTLTLLSRLDRARKPSVVQFLYESGLVDKEQRVVVLAGADLSGANLIRAVLGRADLRGANLHHADLSYANLSEADLIGAFLRDAALGRADLSNANFSEANLQKADLRSALGIAIKGLEAQTKYLNGATLPNGQKYEDWLKS